MGNIDPFFTQFKTPVDHLVLPNKFTFPFYYEPHPLCIAAATELQEHLRSQEEWEHNFGLEEGQDGLVIGKMFGVLVVRTSTGELGYLKAFSGKLGGGNHHSGFVPPVFDYLTSEGFFRKGEIILNELNRRVEELENDPIREELRSALESVRSAAEKDISQFKKRINTNKSSRKTQREVILLNPDPEIRDQELEILRRESIREQYALKDLNKSWKDRVSIAENEFYSFENKLEELKEERRIRSSELQQQLFDNYFFLNTFGEQKSLGQIFREFVNLLPPAGAGECAAPKLLQHAFKNDYTPIAMAEFWWGESPRSEVRIHGNFYPACRGKCEPILGHMLRGIEMETNPMLSNPAEGKDLKVIYEDEVLVVVNKPAEFLSVPGKSIDDSVLSRMKSRYPEATGPLLVHRLDMSTSGILLIAKNKEVHQHLQDQFIRRKVSKRYVAMLDGIVKENEGLIDLPLRVDLEDRPRQLVCFEHGKGARTRFEVIERNNGGTRIYFYPITGRTHQLRVHSAHVLGLKAPIKGDDLYGIKGDRLYLHAESLTITHPVTKERVTFQADPEF